jgi:hypothetical protein
MAARTGCSAIPILGPAKRASLEEGFEVFKKSFIHLCAQFSQMGEMLKIQSEIMARLESEIKNPATGEMEKKTDGPTDSEPGTEKKTGPGEGSPMAQGPDVRPDVP